MMDSRRMKYLTLVFLCREHEVLLAMKKRGFGAGRWNGVGGKLEAGETEQQAMLRETKEEIDVELTAYEKVAQLRFDERYQGEETIMNVAVYVATAWTGEPQESEEMQPQWFGLESVPYHEMWADDEYWLPAVLAGGKVRGSFKLDDDDHIVAYEVNRVEELE